METKQKINIETEDKFILDACCGGRQIWFQKEQENTIFMDIRQEAKGTIKLQPNWSCEPNVIGDYRDMPFKDNSFKLIVWDIPHKIKQDRGIIEQKYGHQGICGLSCVVRSYIK